MQRCRQHSIPVRNVRVSQCDYWYGIPEDWWQGVAKDMQSGPANQRGQSHSSTWGFTGRGTET